MTSEWHERHLRLVYHRALCLSPPKEIATPKDQVTFALIASATALA
jgi:hypothetical protein